MDDDTTVKAVKRLLAHIDNKTTDYAPSVMRMPIARYFDFSIAAAERERIFLQSPFVAARSSELPHPGDFVTTEYIGTPLLMVRQADMSVSAFINVCRHRGGRIEFEKSGNRRQFICNYHGWCYGQDGSLRGISFPAGYPDVNRADNALPSLPVDERFGCIWVVPTPGDELNMKTYLGEFDEGVEASGIGAAVLLRERQWELSMNWKLVMDGFLDTQHVGFLHPQSVGPLFHANIHLLDTVGKNTRLVVARRSIDGVRGADVDAVELRRHIGCNYTVYPATIIVVVPYHYELWTISPHPTDVGKTHVVVRFLAKEGPISEADIHARDENWSKLLDALSAEDWPMAQSIQDSLPRGLLAETLYGRNDLPAQAYYNQIQRDLDASSG
ncbi:hypothetical protein GCM10022251_77450 [Phytohabitans flavus]|uniref:Rieske domain-containing protein n=1 Tax=Phytohabitans flavus TaxID=1076124 RepID=A0A6F8XIN4_9ACTN|nr:aromatic ring-hydroxylating dioxygenase subunit alpha [Phytohabitans flavus]BCB73663.1 hypothetical protein Pflav_000730 [Phytohabitans flavus]